MRRKHRPRHVCADHLRAVTCYQTRRHRSHWHGQWWGRKPECPVDEQDLHREAQKGFGERAVRDDVARAAHEDAGDVGGEHEDEQGNKGPGGRDLGGGEGDADASGHESEPGGVEPEVWEGDEDHGGVEVVHGGGEVQQARKRGVDGQELPQGHLQQPVSVGVQVAAGGGERSFRNEEEERERVDRSLVGCKEVDKFRGGECLAGAQLRCESLAM